MKALRTKAEWLAAAPTLRCGNVWAGGFRATEPGGPMTQCGPLPPDDHLLLQGELLRTPEGLYLRYTRLKEPMRLALQRDQHHAWNLRAHELLRQACWPQSLVMLTDLLDQDPEGILEFGAYSCALGLIPHHNTIIWEWRRY